jgi:hypothetical protein
MGVLVCKYISLRPSSDGSTRTQATSGLKAFSAVSSCETTTTSGKGDLWGVLLPGEDAPE